MFLSFQWDKKLDKLFDQLFFEQYNFEEFLNVIIKATLIESSFTVTCHLSIINQDMLKAQLFQLVMIKLNRHDRTQKCELGQEDAEDNGEKFSRFLFKIFFNMLFKLYFAGKIHVICKIIILFTLFLFHCWKLLLK